MNNQNFINNICFKFFQVNQDDLTVPRIPQRDHLAKPAKAPRQQLKNDPENNVLLTGHEIQNFQMKTVSVNSIVFTRAMY